MKRRLLIVLLILSAAALACSLTPTPTATPEEDGGSGEVSAEPMDEEAGEEPVGDFPMADIANDEGGPVLVTGEVAYTNPFFTAGVAEPMVILEDQAGFVDRDLGYLMPPESQTIGQITSDFFTSPFTYSIAMPAVPQAGLRDVDNDGEDDTGVMVFTPAYWTNTYGDPFLEKRDLGGGGWSTAYAGTRVDPDRSDNYEVIGGTYLVYAPDRLQGFPSGFGDDGLLFTEDDPIVGLPQGWTMVSLDSDPFTFDRSKEVVIDLIEGESSEVDDFSAMSYTEAFDAMLEKFRKEYAFTEFKGIDWDAKEAEFRPRFEEAEANNDTEAYQLAMRDFVWSIPDGHVGMSFTNYLSSLFTEETGGGLGMSIMDVDDGRVLVNFLTEGGPAQEADIELGAEIIALDGTPIDEVVDAARPWSMPFSNPQNLRLQQLRYAIRFPLGTEVDVTYQNPGGAERTVTLETSPERESFDFSSFAAGLTGDELPLDYDIQDNGYAYVKIYSFLDNQLLTIQLWERMITFLNENSVPGVVIDMRQNGGGYGFTAAQMAGYFYDEEKVLGNTGYWDEEKGEFYFDPDRLSYLYPPAEELRYDGNVAVLVGPSCSSACEFFSYDMTIDGRATVVGQYATGGLGGSVEQFYMPDGMTVQFTIGRAVDADGNIHIEGTGVVPDVEVPVTEETLFSEGDPVLERAYQVVSEPRGAGTRAEGLPVVDTDTDLLAALQEGVPFLDDFAQESYTEEELQVPGTFTFTIPLTDADSEYMWAGFWCTETAAQLDDNIEKIEWGFSIDGEEYAPADMGYFLDRGVQLQTPCVIYYALLSDWPVGEHELVSTMTFTEPLNDGFADYPAGDYISEFRVVVAP